MQRHRRGILALCLALAALPLSAAVTGVVMSTDGKPVAGARVSIRAFESAEAARARMLSASPEMVPLASTQTDSKGVFSLESPKEPTVELSIYARGYEPQQRRIERDEDLGAIALSKVEMRNGNVTSGGKPVANANVFVSFGTYEYHAKTDAQGRYEAPDPKSARSISVVHPDFAPDEETFTIGNNVSASALSRTLSAGSELKGRVLGDKDTPLANAIIVVDGWPLATSADDGTFTIAHMPAKWKAMRARKDDLIGQRGPGKESPLPIRIAKGATLTGRVTDMKSRMPVAGAVVRVGPRPSGTRAPEGSAMSILTDAKGMYSVVVPAGTYMITAVHPGYDMKQTDAGAVAGQAMSRDLAIAPLGRVSGVVLDEEKRAVAVAFVSPEEGSMGRGMMSRMLVRRESAVSGPDGRFSMRVSTDEDFSLRATKRGFPAAKSDLLKLTPGEKKSGIVLTVPSGIAVNGRVTDANGDPLSGVAVIATESEGMRGGMNIMRFSVGGPGSSNDDPVRSASDGSFTMRVKEGSYDFQFKREGYATKTVRAKSVSATSSPEIEASLDPAVEISGRVSRGGAGIEDVRIFAMVPGDSVLATTGPDGSFTLSGLSAGPVRVMARKDDDFINETRNITAPARDVNIEIKPGSRVSGRVIDKATSKPITAFSAGTSASRAGGGMVMMAPPLLREFLSEDGSFTLENVPSGATSLVASAPGYSSARMNLNVEEGKEIEGLELQLDTGVKLVGRVTGPNGSPLSDVRVQLVPSPTGNFASGTMDRGTSTDSNGEYTIEALQPGDETVSFTHADHADTRKSVTLKGKETRLDAQLTSGLRITGTVVTDAGAPLADADVGASANNDWQRARTDANGSFTFDSLIPGRYRFTASKAGYADGMVEDVDVSSGAPVRITMNTGGTISGRVTGLSAQELTTAQVEAYSGRSGTRATVDSSGNYRIEGVAAGTVQVQASTGNGMAGTSRRSATQTVDLNAGGSAQVDIAFRDDIVISGRVTRNGAPIQGGTVGFVSRSSNGRGGASAPTDEQGYYTINGLEEGEYSVMVSDMQRLSPYTTSYTVRGTSTFDIDYRTSQLRGRVIDAATNEPIANVAMLLRNADQGVDVIRVNRNALTDVNGTFALDSIPPGNYTLNATKDGYGNEMRDVRIADSASDDVELRMSSNTGVTLNVVDARDGRTLSARATVYDMQGRVVDEGRFSFGGGEAIALKIPVAPGNYTATVSAGGYAPRNISFQSPSNQTVALSPGGTLLIRSKHTTPMRIRLIDANGMPYWRSGFSSITSRELLPSPGTTTYSNVASGTYTLQLLDGEMVIQSKQITVAEGQIANEEI